MIRQYDVLLAGYYGFGNLGDELLAEACVRLLERNGVSRERIAILSADPECSKESLRIRAFNRWNISDIYKALKDSKTILFGGGGLFQDKTSLRSCMYYWFLIQMARFCQVKIWAVGQSLGPINTAAGAFFTRMAFSVCSYRNVRNRSSLGILNNWGFFCTQSPDLVMSLKVKRDYERGDKLLLNLRTGYDKVSRLTVNSAMKTAEDKNLRISAVAFSEEDLKEFEKYVYEGVLRLDQITVVKNLIQFEDILSRSSCAIGMRLHFIILAFIAGLPVRGAAYDPKVVSFCKEWDIPVVGSAETEFSSPVEAGILEETADKVARSFKEGISAVLGEAYGDNKN
ncbi:MAG: polysaccharide pyruvyl transferase CsaB [Synergistaceae bacterium]|nr:polysaccharide pyruvyl transferase CsaB [Synergistaceae bacterium]